MPKAKITFANGDELMIVEGQLIIPIIKQSINNAVTVSEGKTIEVWSHVHKGLIPSLLEMLCTSDYFQIADDDSKAFNSASVVSVLNI